MPVAKKGQTVEQILAIWAKQPGAFVTLAEREFIDDMRTARSKGVGYGWMKQIIDWEWAAVDPTYTPSGGGVKP